MGNRASTWKQPLTKFFKTRQNTRIMARKDTLTQRERKSRAKAQTVEEIPASTEEKPQRPPTVIPQEQFIRWLGLFYKEHLTTNNIIEFCILAFAAHQAYLKFIPAYEAVEEDYNLFISACCALVAMLMSFVIIYRANLESPEKQLPPWNTVYLIFLPTMLSFVLNKDLLLYNAALSLTMLDLPIFAKLLIEMTIIQSNSELAFQPIYNAKIVGSHMIVNYVLSKISELKSWDIVENNLFSILIIDLFIVDSTAIHIIILRKLMISFGVGLWVVYLIISVYKQNNLARSVLLSLSWVSSFIYSALYQLNPILEGNAITWLNNYVTSTQTRVNIITLWLSSLVLLIPTIFNFKLSLSSNFRRKIWHFLVIILLVYPFLIDPDFVKLALSGALVLFFIVELIRYLKLYPFGEFIDSHLREFADFRDEKGPVIISYIYLFLGITLPILFNDSIIGLLVLGVGDSLASIIGSNFGEIPWANTNKTLEGTFTFILSTYALASLLKWVGWFFAENSYHALLLTCTVSGILEGNSNMNDNILIPGYMVVLLAALN